MKICGRSMKRTRHRTWCQKLTVDILTKHESATGKHLCPVLVYYLNILIQLMWSHFFFYFLKRSNVSNQRDHGATLRLVVGGGGWGGGGVVG